MQRAIEISMPFKYLVKPNPMVGALIAKGERIVSEGAHQKYGEAHAEVNCFDLLKEEITDEHVMICSLEPCNHQGKTGPCTEKIIASGIKKIIIGSLDPNPKVAGKGIKKLKDAGIEVVQGILEDKVKELNRFFFFKHINGRPFISIKIACSADGMSHNLDGSSTWITSKESREDVQLVRAEFDAILTGGNTVRNDNPRMNARVNFEINQPKKILLTSQSVWNENMNFFQTSDVEIIAEKNLHTVIDKIAHQNINSVLVEAGPKLVNALLKECLCDELILYESPDNLGDAGVSWFDGNKPFDNFGFNLTSSYTIDRDKKSIYTK
jgi:diaminohydroxyphosphoribosylaminopyrimidine deaminase/5-amino-6-(5-phosphoribosylamino)uracil reductase